MIRRWSAGQWALRSAAAGGLLVALFATGLLGVWPAPWLVLAVGGLAVWHGLYPESPVGTVAIGLVLAWWGIAFRDGLQPQALVAAAGLLVAHLAGLVAGLGPDRIAVDRATVLLWVRRGAAAFLLAPVVWVVAALVRDRPAPAGIWTTGLVAALVTVGVLAVAHTWDRAAGESG